MKKKWITLKRLWRKLGAGDRLFFGCQIGLFVVNLVLCFLSPGCIVNMLWIGLITWNHCDAISRARRMLYAGHLIGNARGHLFSAKRLVNLAMDYDNCARELKKTRSDYCKLQYDYNKLKKEVRKMK